MKSGRVECLVDEDQVTDRRTLGGQRQRTATREPALTSASSQRAAGSLPSADVQLARQQHSGLTVWSATVGGVNSSGSDHDTERTVAVTVEADSASVSPHSVSVTDLYTYFLLCIVGL